MVSRRGLDCPRCGTNLDFTHADYEAPPDREPSPAPVLLEFAPGDRFAGRYTIVDRVGAGSMGVVYKARDNDLDGQLIALKLVQPSLAGIPECVERFRREVRLTRKITHHGVCRVHDLGEWAADRGRVLFLSMEWIEGETLQQLLRQTGMLKESRALEIAEGVAEALEAAHAEGVIHRDIKPGNIMVDRRGQVFVTDFGLALELSDGSAEQGETVVGTPYYMSPEQRAGAALDERSDFYALGLVLREMLTGVRMEPVPGVTHELRAWLNPVILPVLERLLAASADQRFESAAEIRNALREAREDPSVSAVISTARAKTAARRRRRPVVVAAGVLALSLAAVVGVGLLRHRPRFEDSQAEVLYDRGMAYLRGENDTVRSTREAIHMLHRASDPEPRNALIWAGLGEAYWKLFTRTRAPTARDEAERAVAKALSLDPDLPEALYARAIGYSEEGKNHAALDDLRKVVAALPRFAPARALMGLVRGDLGQYAEGLADLDAAVAGDPADFRVHVYQGLFHERFSEYEEAARCYRRATELKPDSFIAWNNLGAELMLLQDYEQAAAALRRALEIEEDATAWSNLGTALYGLGRIEESLSPFERAVGMEPDNPRWHGNLGDAQLALGRESEARGSYERAAARAHERVTLKPLDVGARVDLALYCAKSGQRRCALDEARHAAELQPDNAEVLFYGAVVHSAVGETETALDWLERAVQRGASRAMIDTAPELERLRDHPRFRRLLELLD